MGELQGRREPDRPEQPPPDDAQPRPRVEIRNTPGPRPAPGPADVLINPRTPRDRPEPAKRDTSDGPTHRPPDLIPPRGEDLAEKDAPGASRIDKVRNKLLDKENLGDLTDVTDHAGDVGYKLLLGPRPTGQAEVQAPQPAWHRPPHQALDGGQALTAMLVTGLLVGEGLKRVYDLRNELKERTHGRHG